MPKREEISFPGPLQSRYKMHAFHSFYHLFTHKNHARRSRGHEGRAPRPRAPLPRGNQDHAGRWRRGLGRAEGSTPNGGRSAAIVHRTGGGQCCCFRGHRHRHQLLDPPCTATFIENAKEETEEANIPALLLFFRQTAVNFWRWSAVIVPALPLQRRRPQP